VKGMGFPTGRAPLKKSAASGATSVRRKSSHCSGVEHCGCWSKKPYAVAVTKWRPSVVLVSGTPGTPSGLMRSAMTPRYTSRSGTCVTNRPKHEKFSCPFSSGGGSSQSCVL